MDEKRLKCPNCGGKMVEGTDHLICPDCWIKTKKQYPEDYESQGS